MKHALFLLPLFALLLLPSCSQKVLPEESILIAKSYAALEWQPEPRHIRHGPDSKGILVQTPDTSLTGRYASRAFWTAGVPATSMPYKWGGFDTPKSFLKGLKAGKSRRRYFHTAKNRRR